MSDVDSTVPAGFRKIPGFPRYAINEDGTVISICGRGYGSHRNRPWSEARRLVPVVDSRGYYVFNLSYERNKERQLLAHTLVLETFIGPCPDGMECRHLDGNKINNHITNLKWGTPRENEFDKVMHGTSPQGERSNFAKLTNDDVLEIRKRAANGERPSNIAADFSTHYSNVWLIVTRRTWKHI